MLTNFDNDFVITAKAELKKQEQQYNAALKEDRPFEVLKNIQTKIKQLRIMLYQHGQSNNNIEGNS
jgi:hypothetical protein